MNTWAERIRSRMKALELTQEDLAAKLGITRGAVTHYLAGRRVPPLRQFQKLASVLKADPAWLQFGTNNEVEQSKPTKKAVKAEINHRPIPILTWKQATERLDVSRMKAYEMKECIPHLRSVQPRWYALQVKGDAMTATTGNISFHDGDIIIIDPDKTPKHGDFIVAALPKAKEATFKQYVIDGGVQYLKPLNRQYPLIEAGKGTSIFGVVISNIKILM